MQNSPMLLKKKKKGSLMQHILEVTIFDTMGDLININCK